MARLTTWAIILVVLGHSSPETIAAPATAAQGVFRGILDAIYLFHMPLFFFISGSLLAHTQKVDRPLNYGRFVLGKARRLLLPYWFLSTLAFPIKVLMKGQAVRPVDGTPFDYLRTLLVPWQNTIIYFWFLPTLFLLFLAAPVLLKAARARILALDGGLTLLLVALSVLIIPIYWDDPLNYRGALSHASTFWLGILWRSRVPTLSARALAALGLGAAILFGLLWVVLYVRWIPHSTPAHALLRLGLAWTGVLACLGFAELSARIGIGGASWLDGWSYPIYLLSWFPQTLVKLGAFRALGLGYWPCALLMLVSGFVVPILVAREVRRRCPKLLPLVGL